MTEFLQVLAILAQISDITLTCKVLASGGKEMNPLLPKTCTKIALVKAGLTAPIFFLPGDKEKKIWASAMIASGSVGIVLTIKFR